MKTRRIKMIPVEQFQADKRSLIEYAKKLF
jgi:hypothetical protein